MNPATTTTESRQQCENGPESEAGANPLRISDANQLAGSHAGDGGKQGIASGEPEGDSGRSATPGNESRLNFGNYGAAVERRWAEVCEHLEAYAGGKPYSPQTLREMLGELNALYVVTQYAGSNSRTGWYVSLLQYKELVNG